MELQNRHITGHGNYFQHSTFYSTRKSHLKERNLSKSMKSEDQTSSISVDKNDQLNRNIDYLQTMIDDMIKEYEYMDQPLKFPQKQESSSITPTTDNSIFLTNETT